MHIFGLGMDLKKILAAVFNFFFMFFEGPEEFWNPGLAVYDITVIPCRSNKAVSKIRTKQCMKKTEHKTLIKIESL